MAYLQRLDPDDSILQVFQLTKPVTTIGRKDADITLIDKQVSRLHAKICLSGCGQFVIFDCDSSNGTFVNGQKRACQVLKSGDVILVGDSRLVFFLTAIEGSTIPLNP